MNRREMLLTAGAAVGGLSVLSLETAAWGRGNKRKRVFYFTRSNGMVHSVVDRIDEDIFSGIGSGVADAARGGAADARVHPLQAALKTGDVVAPFDKARN